MHNTPLHNTPVASKAATMPGSLNYSPSGSEGGRSLGGGDLVGVDLTNTPGTTPLKWRKRGSSIGSGRHNMYADRAEDEISPTTTKQNGPAKLNSRVQASDQVQDQTNPGMATRKPSWEESRRNGVPSATVDDPAGFVENPSTFRSVAMGAAGPTTARDRSRGQKPPSSGQSTPRRPSFSSSSTASRVVDGVAANRREDTSDGQPRLAARSSAEGVGLASYGSYPNEQNLTHGEQSRSEAGDGDVDSLKEHGYGPRLQETSTSAPSVLGDEGVPDSRARNGHPRGDEDGVEHVFREEDDQHQRHQPRRFPTPSPPASTAAQEIAAALVGGTGSPRGENVPPDEEAQREGNNKGTNDNPPGEHAEAAAQIKDSRLRDPGSPNVENAAAPTTGRRKSQETRSRRATDTGSVTETAGGGNFTNTRQSESPDITTAADYALSDGDSNSEDGRSRAVRQVTTGKECHDEDTSRSKNRRNRSGSAEGSCPAVAGEQDDVAQQESEKPVFVVGESSHSTDAYHHRRKSRNSHTGEGGHHEESRHQPQHDAKVAVNGRPGLPSDKLSEDSEVRTTKLLSSSNNRGVLQSPPMLSRRKASDNAVSDRKLRWDKAVTETSGRQEREEGATERHGLDSPGGGEQCVSSPHGPPPLTPRRYGPKRGASAAAVSPMVSATPGSPVAVAARVISQEESVRSTLRMKRAAEAIALEDARILAEARRQEVRRRRKSEHRVAASPPLPRPEDDHGDDPAEEEDDDARARQAEKMRVRALRALVAREEAEIDRDRALELTLEVLRRKHADKRRGVSTIPSAPGSKRAHSPPRKSRRPDDHRTNLARRVKDSAARSCGLSQAQVLLLRRSRKLGREGDAPRTVSERRTEQLAQPKEHRPATRTRNPATEALVEELTRTMTDTEKRAFLHACLADAKECTHRPYTRSAAAAARHRRGGAGDGGTAGGEEAKDGSGPRTSIDAFLYRMDAQERAKNAAMEHRRGELAYKAVLDKRVCPGCGAEQSYDEVEEKRKICPNCEAEYRKPKTWASVRKDFLNRVEAFQESKREAFQAAMQSTMRTYALGSRRSYDGAERERLFWEDIEDDFVFRLQEDAARRQASLESRSAAPYQDWTFRPTLSAASERVVDGSAWAGMSFLERVEGDLQRRREANPAFANNDDRGGSFGGSFAFTS